MLRRLSTLVEHQVAVDRNSRSFREAIDAVVRISRRTTAVRIYTSPRLHAKSFPRTHEQKGPTYPEINRLVRPSVYLNHKSW